MGSNLSSRLREETRAIHEATETRGFVQSLLGGELSLDAFAMYQAQYAWVYEALESRPRLPDDPELIHDARLHRASSLDSDLAALGLADWRVTHPPLPSTQAYIDRLREVAAGPYPNYVAHHYVRYLGDLSGGQAIAALMARSYGATEDQLSFYRFAGIDSLVHYKRDYREALDALPLTEAQVEAVVGEAMVAFGHNGALFDELNQSRADSGEPSAGQLEDARAAATV